jgi:hypothetical protein
MAPHRCVCNVVGVLAQPDVASAFALLAGMKWSHVRGPAPAAAWLQLGSYEVRLEYVCMDLGGCTARTFTLRWASFPSAFGSAPFVPIPPSLLLPTQVRAQLSGCPY